MTHNAQGACDDKVKNLGFAMSKEQVSQQWLAWVSLDAFSKCLVKRRRCFHNLVTMAHSLTSNV